MDCCENKSHGGKMEIEKKKIALWVLVGILVLALVYAVFLRDAGTAITLGSNTGSAASAYSGMVGGC